MAKTDSSTEIWKPVVGFEGVYSVSNLGRIRRDKPEANTFAGRIMKLKPTKYGYITVCLTSSGKRVYAMVHVLVAAAFIGIKPKGYECNHKDAVKSHNHLSNLEYLTKKENAEHAVKMGHYRRGEHAPRAKLVPSQVRVIKYLIRTGDMTLADIARVFKITPESTGAIKNGKSWTHV